MTKFLIINQIFFLRTLVQGGRGCLKNVILGRTYFMDLPYITNLFYSMMENFREEYDSRLQKLDQQTTELKQENEKLKEELSTMKSKPAKKETKVPADLSVSCRFTHIWF